MTLKVIHVTGAELALLDAELRAAEIAYYEANPDTPMPVFLSGRGMKVDWARNTMYRDPGGLRGPERKEESHVSESDELRKPV